MRRERDDQAVAGRREEDGAAIRGFRALLGAGAMVYLLLGAAGLLLTGALHGTFGPDVQASVPGFLGMARVFGALSLAVGAGFVVGAIDPLRNRGLLFVLFLVPLLMAIASIIAAAKSELAPAKGAVFAGLNLAFVLLYFRLYPRPAVGEEDGDSARASGSRPDEDDQPSSGDKSSSGDNA